MPWFRTLAFVSLALASLSRPAHAAPPHAAALDPVVFEAPAGGRASGPTVSDPTFGRILPSGRILQPAGRSAMVGSNALGVALSPDGRYAIVSSASEAGADAVSPLDDRIRGGYSLAVIDTLSMRVIDVHRAAGETYFGGIVAERDPADPAKTLVLASGGASAALFAFDLDANGVLSPDARHVIPLGRTGAYPGALALSPRGDRAFAADETLGAVSVIDVATRTASAARLAAGFAPSAVATTTTGLLVANAGLMAHAPLPAPVAAPAFSLPTPDPERASSLTSYAFDATGAPTGAAPVAVALDRSLSVTATVGGVQPAAIAAVHGRPYAFIALANVDRIATLALGEQPRVVGGTELRLFDRGPYGTQPDALALSPDGRRLYVALAGIDAIAVLDTSDPLRPHRLGLIPTGWHPSALALSADGRTIFVLNAKGVPTAQDWSTLERIDLREIDLRRTTPLALSHLRRVVRTKPNRLVPQRFLGLGSAWIKHVVVVHAPPATFDAVLADLSGGVVAAGALPMPNLHALARTFAFARNFYVDAGAAGGGHLYADAGIVTPATERVLPVLAGRAPLENGTDDPEDYSRAGFVFDSLLARRQTFRDYGDLLRLSGRVPGTPGRQTTALYSLDVPALAALAGAVDLAYPADDAPLADTARVAEFERDFDPLAKAGAMPAFADVSLPGAGGGADSDRALGALVAYLSHLPQWSSTAIFIAPVGTGGAADRVDARHAYAIVVSPFAKRGYIGAGHLSTVGILKTEEELLGLPALSLGDALATDLADFFTPVSNLAPFDALPES